MPGAEELPEVVNVSIRGCPGDGQTFYVFETEKGYDFHALELEKGVVPAEEVSSMGRFVGGGDIHYADESKLRLIFWSVGHNGLPPVSRGVLDKIEEPVEKAFRKTCGVGIATCFEFVNTRGTKITHIC